MIRWLLARTLGPESVYPEAAARAIREAVAEYTATYHSTTLAPTQQRRTRGRVH